MIIEQRWPARAGKLKLVNSMLNPKGCNKPGQKMRWALSSFIGTTEKMKNREVGVAAGWLRRIKGTVHWKLWVTPVG